MVPVVDFILFSKCILIYAYKYKCIQKKEDTMKIYDHKFMAYFLKDDRLDGVWKPDSKNMSDYEFQYSILRYASFVMEYKIRKVLIDLTNFQFNPSEQSLEFHSDFVTKIYNLVGVQKKVFLAPFMENEIIGKEPGTEYENANIKSYDEAVKWLNA